MAYDISEKVQKWSLERQVIEVDFNDIHATIEDLALKRFHQYVPTTGPHPDFRTRLANWLEQVTEKDQKVLFQLVPEIFFIGRDEFNSLYRSAFRGPITTWLIDECNLNFLAADFMVQLNRAVAETWFCSITDWEIGNFYRINSISGAGMRPDFTSLVQLGDISRVNDFIANEGLQRIVLVEDFVGSGSQMNKIRPMLNSLPNTIPVLIVPLVICPGGIRLGARLERAYRNVKVTPVLKMPESSFITVSSQQNEPTLFQSIRELVQRIYPEVSGGSPPHPRVKPYGPFGFARTGGLVVMYSNCPDNTLPIIHHQDSGSSWNALFPRVSRLS